MEAHEWDEDVEQLEAIECQSFHEGMGAVAWAMLAMVALAGAGCACALFCALAGW